VPLKSKPLGNSGKRLHGTHEERKTVSAAQNGQSYSKTGSNKLTSANKPNFSSVDPRRQLDSNIRNGPGRPTGPKGLPLKKPVATMEKKALAPGAKNYTPGLQKPLTSKLQSLVPKQRLGQKKGLEEPKKSKMMPKQPMTSSKPQVCVRSSHTLTHTCTLACQFFWEITLQLFVNIHNVFSLS
jgi:protein SPT2